MDFIAFGQAVARVALLEHIRKHRGGWVLEPGEGGRFLRRFASRRYPMCPVKSAGYADSNGAAIYAWPSAAAASDANADIGYEPDFRIAMLVAAGVESQ